MTIFQAIVLGAVQGLTEFLPISSSGHLILFPWLFGWKDPGLAFDVFLHLGTLLAVVSYFFREWWYMSLAGIKSIFTRQVLSDRDAKQFWYIVLATIPAVVAGVLFHDKASSIFREPLLIAVALALVGFLMYYVDGKSFTIKNLNDVSLFDALCMGLSQALAIIPGVSRSGATMTMARGLGMKREAAARFSFMMSLPIILGACVYELKDFGALWSQTGSTSALIAGFISSTLVGFATIHGLIRFLQEADFRIFAWYRILLAAFIVGWSLFTGV